MASRAGEWLSTEEVEELEAYRERGVAPPAKFDDVVLDNTHGGNVGAGYRFKTAGEKKAEEETAKAAAATADRRVRLLAKIDAESTGANLVQENRVAVADVDAAGRTVSGSGGRSAG
jgi:hypothetical protein